MKRQYSNTDSSSIDMDIRTEFLMYLQQPDLCELFYNYMKEEDLAYLLEFYLACDGLKSTYDQSKKPHQLIRLIYKHYLSEEKLLSSSSSKSECVLPQDLLRSIEQRLTSREFHRAFYDQAQEYVLKYMLQMCFPKFLIEQQNYSNKSKRQCLNSVGFSSTTFRRTRTTNKRKEKFVSSNGTHPSSSSTKDPTTIAQQNPAAFFQEIKQRLLAYKIDHTTLKDDDSFDVLDRQIAKTIDDADQCLVEKKKIVLQKHHKLTSRSDSGHVTDSSDRSVLRHSSYNRSIDVIWYPSFNSPHALLSTISCPNHSLTFKEFRQLFQKQSSRYFFKTTCTPEINREQYIFRELTHDDELVPMYNGKIFLQLDRIV